MNFYDIIYPKFYWTNDRVLHVFESFAGVGAQAKALRNINANYEVTAISEIDKDAIVSYAAMHCNLNEKITDFEYPASSVMIKTLQEKDIGYDFKTGKHTITERTRLDKLKRYYLADLLTKNLGNISKIHAEDIPDVDMLTYSFPCQDLSRAGRLRGMDKGKNTRSGLLWEIERILDEAIMIDKLPMILVMENVPDVIGTRNYKNFMMWFNKLESLGFQSYLKVVDAVEQGIPQHRERCFMISLLGKFSYQFPNKQKCSNNVLDMMEKKVNSKLYLSQKEIDKILGVKGYNKADCYVHILHHGIKKVERVYQINKEMGEDIKYKQTSRILESRGYASTITCGFTGNYLVPKSQLINQQNEVGSIGNYHVRSLSILEAFRLMGFEDKDVEKMKEAGTSNHQLYRQAGNSIVVKVLEALFSELYERGELGREYHQ